MDERRAEEAIKALNKAGAIKVGTAEGTPVSREHAKEIVQAIRKQKRDELAVDDIVTRLRFVAQIHEGRVKHECIAEAADEIERLHAERDRWRKIADALVEAAEIQVHFAKVPDHYTKSWYSQHLKDALAQYQEEKK